MQRHVRLGLPKNNFEEVARNDDLTALGAKIKNILILEAFFLCCDQGCGCCHLDEVTNRIPSLLGVSKLDSSKTQYSCFMMRYDWSNVSK